MFYILFILITFILLAISFYQWQYFMVFTPTFYRGEELDDDFELLSITTDDGIELEGVVYEPKELYPKLADIKSTLLFFAGRSHDSVGLIKRLSHIFPHVRIITFNYRSYGRSGGSVNEKNILNDGLKIAKIVQKNYGDFYILGFSIGASVASYVASKENVLALFLVGAFDSIENLVIKKYGVNLSKISRYKFDNTLLVENVKAKTYMFVSKDDEIVHVENSRNLKDSVKNLARYKEYENISHKDLLWHKEVLEDINGVMF